MIVHALEVNNFYAKGDKKFVMNNTDIQVSGVLPEGIKRWNLDVVQYEYNAFFGISTVSIR